MLAAGAVTAWLLLRPDAGGGRFRTAPPACESVEAVEELLGVDYVLKPKQSRSPLASGCDLWLRPDDTGYVDAAQMSVAFLVTTGDDPAAAASALMADDREEPIAGLGDEAYSPGDNVYVRVDNLVVGVLVYPLPPSTTEQVRAFTAALVGRLPAH